MVSKSLSTRWSREHGGRGYQRRNGYVGKRAHSSQEMALLESERLNRLRGKKLYQAYSCKWGDDYREGEVADEHWHVGRISLNTDVSR